MPGDLGDGICLVGRLERPGKQGVFADRLRREFRIDAGRAEEQQPIDAGAMRALDDVHLDREVVIKKVRRLRIVRQNAADLRRGEDDRIRPIRLQPILDLGPGG